MATIKAIAPAKVNLTLHVTGQRDDGYHLLDSLVVFADVADQLGATVAPDLRISVSGPFSGGIPTDPTNLMMRAAEALRSVRGVKQGAALTLEKHLPHAAGIGSGSSDAAVTLAMLAELWSVPPLPATAPEVLALGADLPVCLRAPTPTRMSGIGDVLTAVARLPECALVLVRPPVDVPTAAVFKSLQTKAGSPMEPLPEGLDFDGFARWLARQRNDLQAPAEKIAPEVSEALAKLKSLPAVSVAGMSGSGATCFGLVKDMAAARHVARIVQVSQMNWWVAPAMVL
ncbi:4-(cytidine 5'-diphospho)-2-C-methyl-D-erythritol kinase [Cognatiyoonia sp. IB215182]|uniref:4-(cytidine 5'-diphospho)-2-C-methyl-D-erythritol kinase n=1 Tax=Cognatiyoonia sp. IB215182 TaxID=3097353 RepID=UPI002A167AB7|nr:4-(cytidine 5'-diphospho)-2-C-methyl-D-erythritol kinase [Cognatiyoonia sp. IB215182]MDX8352721.1 4-(cytidine 5'-diphospho)-2-C-methyl-D-erythritol kinase [Cognatiyoonia sp. IB215182]